MLKYTEYKEQQALWLQRQLNVKTDGRNRDEFCIDCYWEYLKILGCKDEYLFAKIKHYRSNIETYYLGLGGQFDADKRYFKDIHDRIDELMDGLLK